VKELVVISGKGGTGKTSIAASLAVLAGECVIADCDVDAADLHLVLSPTIERRQSFSAGRRARIHPDRCTACGQCRTLCRFDAIRPDGPANERAERTSRVEALACEGCGVCADYCPARAIEMVEVTSGEWFVSTTRCGPMVHAQLGIAEGNSGKLVSLVRQNARRIAEEHGLDRVLIDGSPGIGCPVIASITGAGLALVVTEPTPSGLHDLARVAELTRHFAIPTLVCINKWDIHPRMAREIEDHAARTGLGLAGRIRYDRAVTRAQIQGRAVVEHTDRGCAEDIRALWETIGPTWTGSQPVGRPAGVPGPDPVTRPDD
jgi:MinD superfamily P-loop ATPase